MICGIDYSINGSGLAFSDGTFHFFSTRKRLVTNLNIDGITANISEPPNKENNTPRYTITAEIIINLLKEKNVTQVNLEGYSYGSARSAGYVFDIAEATGILKHLLYKNNINFTIYPPKKIKKNFTDNGNASKVKMVETYLNKNNENSIIELINQYPLLKYKSPINDLIDAYALLNMTG